MLASVVLICFATACKRSKGRANVTERKSHVQMSGAPTATGLAPAAVQTHPLGDSDLSVRGVTLLMPRADVIARLGDGLVNSNGARVYPGLVVAFLRDSVSQIEVTDSTIATARGLRVGDSETRIVELYGPGGSVGPVYQFTLDDYADGRSLLISTSEGVVTRITVGFFQQQE